MDASANTAEPLSAGEVAEARSRAYHLLSVLITRGFETELLEQARRIPQIEEAFAGLGEEELAAAHHRLLSMQVHPYAGAFEDADGLIGGSAADDFHRLYRESGFEVEVGDTTADHLGFQLAFLGFLSGAEADAIFDSMQGIVTSLQERQRAFLDRMLHWLPGFRVAVLAQAHGPWHAVVELALELVAEHRSSLPGEATAPSFIEAPELLDDDKTGTRRIARFLCTPAYCGLFLSRDDLTVLGREADVPRGFGSRVQMLGNLLLNAGEYGEAGGMVERLETLWRARLDAYASLAQEPVWAVPAQAWRQRAEDALEMLGRMRALLPAPA